MKTLVKYEMKKILQNKTFIGALIVSLFVLAGILFIGFHYSQLQGKAGEGLELYHQVVEKGTGEFSDRKVRAILADYMDRYQKSDVDNRTFDLFSWEIADTFFPNDKSVYTKMNDAMEQGEKTTIDQIDLKTIKEIGFTQFQTPLKIGSFVTWRDLFQVTSQIFILTSIIVILICSLVFSSDTSRNMHQLLLSTKFGRNQLTIAKIIAATLISTFVFLFIQMISLGAFYVYNSGFTGWDTSIQTNFSLKLFHFPAEINQLQVFCLAMALHFISLLSIIAITLYVSSITRSPFSSLAMGLGLFLLPKAFTQLIKRGIVYKLLNLFPINNFRIEDFLTLMSTKQEFILQSFGQNIVVTITVLLVLKIMLNGLIYLRMKQYQIT
ncbi:ABC-type transport system involved in multi-copper enzyme maturation permease subunit [Lederbergia galactosidilyticus]|uniref:ABC transporter permease subunit n=1 Tax=Lederbergia galactosidilytica TaxID=217031 RepID=UPI001AE35279|nr:ABC transporter permease subunit [Lederbergia galactosidilytica]MBP1913946.1 ABC-type transport system involved in multi-copper enzyme maturation permease subunit [Lederbergia galactosidilytica]